MGTCCSQNTPVGDRVNKREGEDRPDEQVEDTGIAAHENIPFPKNGIKLSYLLNEFVDECGGREALEGLTTTDVCNRFVMPITKDYELSYCDLILEKAKQLDTSVLDGVVSSATVFISHVWKYKFLDVLDALEHHFKDEPDKIIWFDLVSNNLIKGPDLDYEWWFTTFKDAIEQLGHTVMVMAPWNNPIPYQRAWNIFEAYCTSVTDAKFEIAMSNTEHRAFIEECKHDPTSTINKMLSIVNAETSEAWDPRAKERIHAVIRNEVGFKKINSILFQQLRDWVLTVGLEELKQAKHDSLDEIELLYLVGCIYKDQGNYENAEPLYIDCKSKCEKVLGLNHSQTLSAMNNLAGLYSIQGKYEEASQLYRAALSKDGMSHEANKHNTVTLTSINNYAELYQSAMNVEPLHIEQEICYANMGIETSLEKEGKEDIVKLHAGSTQAKHFIPFPTNGIKLSYLLKEFVEECGGRESLEGLTTEDICNKFVKPVTKDYELSYCDMILEKAKFDENLFGAVETATVFISHAWKYKYLDVLDALANHFKDEPDKIVWFDLVSNNQHKATTLDFDWWATTFMNAIGQFGHIVMILAPWNDPIPYQRAWCIFEAYCTIVTGAKFEIALSAEERKVFMQECKAGPTQVLNKMLSFVDSEKSEAKDPNDKIQIHEVIRNKVGFAKINSMVFKQMRDWVLKVSVGELAKAEARVDPIDELVSKNLVATLYLDQGAYKEALPLFKDCLEKKEAMLGENHPETLISMSALAQAYENLGKYDLAEPLYKHTLVKRETMLGDLHPLTLASMSNLAGLYHLQENFSDAESLYKVCLINLQKTHGSPDHPSTLACMNNLALAHYKQDNFDDTEILLNECLLKKKSVLGPDHRETLISENNIALLYLSKGKYDEAEKKYKRCVERCEMMLGTDHPDTLATENNFAGLYLSQGRYEKAESLYREILSKSVSLLGSDHPLTLKVAKNLASCKTLSSNLYLSKGKYDEAEKKYKRCVERCLMMIGTDHPDTLATENNLAGFYLSQGRYENAESLYREILSKSVSLLGSDHPLTLKVAKNLASCKTLSSN